MKYQDTLQIEEKPIQYSTLNVVSIMVLFLFPWILGMFTIFDYFFKWNN